MAIEIVDFPIKKMWFSIVTLVHQRVIAMTYDNFPQGFPIILLTRD